MGYTRRPTKEEQKNMAKSKKSKPASRRERKPIGHEGGKRVSALRKSTVKLTGPKGETLFDGTDREFKDAAGRAGRRNTIKPNGGLPESFEPLPESVSIGEAMRLAVEALGDVKVDDDLAPAQMRQLAEAFEQVTREQAAFHQKSEAAKIAKKSLDSATDYLLKRVKEFTHPTPLPLFDAVREENDREAMVNASGAPEMEDGAEAN
jgi:hypothetical protein